MRKGRAHFTQGSEPGDVHQFALQFMQARVGRLPLGQVADEAREEAAPRAGLHLPHRQLHGEGRSIPALTDDHAAYANDPTLAGLVVALQISVVVFPVGFGHQDLDVGAHDLGRGVAEQPLGGLAEGLDQPGLVDHDHGVRHRLEDREEMGLSGDELRGRGLALHDRSPAATAHRRAHEADGRQHAGADQADSQRLGCFQRERKAQGDRRDRPDRPGEDAPIDPGDHDRRRQQRIKRRPAETRPDRLSDQRGGRHQRQGAGRPHHRAAGPPVLGQKCARLHGLRPIAMFRYAGRHTSRLRGSP